MLVGAPVRGTVAIGDVDPWTLMSGDFQGSDEPQRWGEIMLRAMLRSEYQTGNVRVEHTWTSMNSVRAKYLQVCEQTSPRNADGSSPEEDLQKENETATVVVPAGFRKDAITLQEIDELPCSKTFFCCHDFFICACCCCFGGERVENDWRVYVHGDQQPALEAAEEKRLYQWVLVNGTLKSMSPLASDLEDLDLAQGGFRVQAVVKRFALAKWFSLVWWVLLLALVLVLHFAFGDKKSIIPWSLAGPPVLAYWLVVFILLQVAHSAGLSFQKGLETLRRGKNFLVGAGDLGSATVGPNGENAKNARKTGALITDVVGEGANTNTKGKGGNAKSIDEDHAMVSRIASRVGENRHVMGAEDKRIWDNELCCRSLFERAPRFWIWYFPLAVTVGLVAAMARWM
eukprot:g4469.t1